MFSRQRVPVPPLGGEGTAPRRSVREAESLQKQGGGASGSLTLVRWSDGRAASPYLGGQGRLLWLGSTCRRRCLGIPVTEKRAPAQDGSTPDSSQREGDRPSCGVPSTS